MNKPERLSVIEIVRNYLCAGGFDGLYNEGKECCCRMDLLVTCGELNADCRAGYVQPAGSDGLRIGAKLTLRCPYCRAVVGKDDAECLECGAVWD